MTVADFAAYQPEWVTPIAQDYRGYTLHEIPPNGQGIAALIALGILENFDLASLPVDGVGLAAPADRGDEAGLRRCLPLRGRPARRWTSAPSRCSTTPTSPAARKLIDPKRAQDFGPGNPAKGGTIYLTAADERGMMVSFIQSNYMGFGSGVVVPGYGIEPAEPRPRLQPGRRPAANLVAPGKRPFHTIIPAFLTKDGQPVMSFGVMGGDMQPQGHVQTLVRMLDYGQNPQAACDAPRWRFNCRAAHQRRRRRWTRPRCRACATWATALDVINDSYQDFGAGQFIWRLGDPAVEGYVAASDPRRDGQAVGF